MEGKRFHGRKEGGVLRLPFVFQDSKTVKGATAYNYVLKSIPNGIMILDASVNEVIQFTPFKEMNGATQMETKYGKGKSYQCQNSETARQ